MLTNLLTDGYIDESFIVDAKLEEEAAADLIGLTIGWCRPPGSCCEDCHDDSCLSVTMYYYTSSAVLMLGK